MEEIHIREIPLENNLRVDLYDASRKLVGDRWLVRLIVRMRIAVDDVWDAEAAAPLSKSTVKELIGDTVVFEQTKTRTFIDEEQKNDVLQALLDDFARHSTAYLAHPEFGRRFILKRFTEEKKRRAWQQAAAIGDDRRET